MRGRRGGSSRGRRGSRKREWGEGNGFEEAGGYMNAKKNKLLNQFREDVDRSSSFSDGKDIFEGVAIFVNGYTDPPSDELRRIMMTHGGTFHHYLITGKTTHIIAINLPDTKVKNLRGNEIIVHPKWILESVKAQKLLDYRPFLLYSNANNSQPQIMFEKRTKPLSKDANDENFIQEFYGNSRLHHISSMANDFKRLVSEMRDGRINDNAFPSREKLKDLPPAQTGDESIIMHIDMDCFFVSVGLRSRPELCGKPVGVTHSKNSEEGGGPSDGHSMSEIASCSYEARKAGVKNGMFVGNAKQLCPQLVFIPYEFDAYMEVARKLYEIVADYTLDIQAVSCDEMLVDLKDIKADPVEFAEHLRREVFEITGCHASVGLGRNILLAKLATRNAKPNGVFRVPSNEEQISSFMQSVAIRDLPGVGRKLGRQFTEKWGINICGEARSQLTLKSLQDEFGPKTGKSLYNGVRGISDIELSFQHERKSVSAEVNYGIRFKEESEAHDFLERLSQEVSIRCRNLSIPGGRSITLKLMIRAEGAPKETSKYMGHGICDNKSKTSTLSVATRDKIIILREAKSLLRKMETKVSDIRGVGIQIGKLDANGSSSADSSAALMMSFINKKPSPSKSSEPKHQPSTSSTLSMSQIDKDVFDSLPEDIKNEIQLEIKAKQPPFISSSSPIISKRKPSIRGITFSQLDPEVLAHLPPDLLDEVKESYGSGPSTRKSLAKSDAFKVLMSPTKSPVKRSSPVKRRGRPRLNASPRKGTTKTTKAKSTTKTEPGGEESVPIVRKRGRPRLNASPRKQAKIVPPKIAQTEKKEHVVPVSLPPPVEEVPEFSSEPFSSSEIDLNGVTDLDGIRALLFEWTSSMETPTEDDAQTVSSFFLEKLSESEFDFVRMLLLQVRRLVSGRNESLWKNFYSDLHDKVQNHMMRSHGMRLFI